MLKKSERKVRLWARQWRSENAKLNRLAWSAGNKESYNFLEEEGHIKWQRCTWRVVLRRRSHDEMAMVIGKTRMQRCGCMSCCKGTVSWTWGWNIFTLSWHIGGIFFFFTLNITTFSRIGNLTARESDHCLFILQGWFSQCEGSENCLFIQTSGRKWNLTNFTAIWLHCSLSNRRLTGMPMLWEQICQLVAHLDH